MVDNLINLKNVWKIYDFGETKIEALRGLNLNIKKNEFLSIMGPSGSGKSTLLNSIGCLDIPTKGVIYLKNKDITHLEESELSQIRGKIIGFIFQSFNLIGSLDAINNVILPMSFQNIEKEKRIRKAKELLTQVGLSERLSHRPNQLSGGEKQRVAIARALANNPELILADEPTGNLDSKSGKIIMEILKKLHKKYHKTIILVTHDLNIARYAKRKVSLFDGRII
ncbi:ABC transporter ATP-binding protein [Candidatus Woesearchaeota archaeon]|nr:ABC transporter ATP-binding protein [Candidatus Woesearchaeota archaeon]